MKLAKQYLEMCERGDTPQSEAGDTSPSEDGHYHKHEIDFKGNGKTIETLPLGFEDHTHVIINNEATESGHGHTHFVVA